MLGFAGVEIFRKEEGFLRIYKLYLDLNKKDDIRKRNLNSLIIQQFLKNEYLRDFFTDETTISFSEGIMGQNFDENALRRLAKPEETVERMQKKYKYQVNFLDLSKGTFGQIFGDCIYNHDDNFYFKKIIVLMIKPVNEKLLLLDESEMIDLD